MTISSKYVIFGKYCLSITSTNENIISIEEEVGPFFSFIEPSNDKKVIGSIRHINEKIYPPRNVDGCVVEVDTSLYRHLSSKGMRWDQEDNITCRIDKTNSWFYFDKESNDILIYQADNSLFVLDVIRLVKSLFTIQCENYGGVQLHASAINTENGSVLLLGDMWQGKTTLLLELMSKFVVSQISCDTIVLDKAENGSIAVNGWPSPFSVSHGTMSDHEQLRGFVPEERKDIAYSDLWKQGKKTVFSSKYITKLFDSSIVPMSDNIHSVLYVRYNPDEKLGFRVIDNQEEVEEILNIVYLGSRDPIYHNWHKFIVCNHDKIKSNIKSMAKLILDKTNVLVLNWGPSAESLFRSIPLFDQIHKSRY